MSETHEHAAHLFRKLQEVCDARMAYEIRADGSALLHVEGLGEWGARDADQLFKLLQGIAIGLALGSRPRD